MVSPNAVTALFDPLESVACREKLPATGVVGVMRGTGPVSVKLLALLQQELGRDLRAATLAMIDSIG